MASDRQNTPRQDNRDPERRTMLDDLEDGGSCNGEK